MSTGLELHQRSNTSINVGVADMAVQVQSMKGLGDRISVQTVVAFTFSLLDLMSTELELYQRSTSSIVSRS